MNLNLKPFFVRKKIIYAKNLQPAELLTVFTAKGKKYARIAFTNNPKFPGTVPVTDVPFSQICSMKRLPSRFEKWIYAMVGRRAPSKWFIINRHLMTSKAKQ